MSTLGPSGPSVDHFGGANTSTFLPSCRQMFKNCGGQEIGFQIVASFPSYTIQLLVLSPLPLSLKVVRAQSNITQKQLHVGLWCTRPSSHPAPPIPSHTIHAIPCHPSSKGLPDGLRAHTKLLHAFDTVTNHSTGITVHAALHVPAARKRNIKSSPSGQEPASNVQQPATNQ